MRNGAVNNLFIFHRYYYIVIENISKVNARIDTYSNIFEYNIFDNIFGIQKKILLYHIPLMNDYNFLNFNVIFTLFLNDIMNQQLIYLLS